AMLLDVSEVLLQVAVGDVATQDRSWNAVEAILLSSVKREVVAASVYIAGGIVGGVEVPVQARGVVDLAQGTVLSREPVDFGIVEASPGKPEPSFLVIDVARESEAVLGGCQL